MSRSQGSCGGCSGSWRWRESSQAWHGGLGGPVVGQGAARVGAGVLRTGNRAAGAFRGSGEVDVLPDEQRRPAASGAGFAAVGSVREEMMKKVVLSTPDYRQRFVLEIVRHEGTDEPLFEIARCHAVGWIEADRAVEKEWAAE